MIAHLLDLPKTSAAGSCSNVQTGDFFLLLLFVLLFFKGKFGVFRDAMVQCAR